MTVKRNHTYVGATLCKSVRRGKQGGMNGVMMKKTLFDKLRDKLDCVWEWVKVILLWLLIIGGIVLGSFLEHVVFVI